MELKKFNNLEEFLNSNEYQNKDLSYCDLSNLDLSNIDKDKWKNFLFFHTNFTNTNIKFNPQFLRKNQEDYHIIEYCDFTNCDLSYMHYKDFETCSINNSCFFNTKLNVSLIDTSFKDVIFSIEMQKEVEYEIATNHKNIELLIKNPHFIVSSSWIKKHLTNYWYYEYLTDEKRKTYASIIRQILEIDKNNEGYLYKFYEILGGLNFSDIEVLAFTKMQIYNKTYKDIDFSFIPIEILDDYEFYNCKFNKIIMPNDIIKESLNLKLYNDTKTRIIIPYIIIPDMNFSSWQDLKIKRIGNTGSTFKTNLYLELDRSCNANCFFCRNKELEDCKFDIKKIKNNLSYILKFVDNIVIGGGEPTFYMEYLSEITSLIYFNYKRIGKYITTNGSCRYDKLKELMNSYNINLSRHAINDLDNDKIFGINTIKTEDIKKLSMYSLNTLTLTATCFKNGLDSVQKLEEYIELSDYVKASVLFQTLHEDLSELPKNQIDTNIFNEVINHLKGQYFMVSELPIYSTGNYKLIIAKRLDGEKTIAFKQYITKEELENNWYKASKRTFDLSMAPNGDIYENWNQTSKLVLTKNLRK